MRTLPVETSVVEFGLSGLQYARRGSPSPVYYDDDDDDDDYYYDDDYFGNLCLLHIHIIVIFCDLFYLDVHRLCSTCSTLFTFPNHIHRGLFKLIDLQARVHNVWMTLDILLK